MYRTIFVIKSENGFLQDVEKYTCIIDEAVQFTTFDSAVDKLKTVRHRLNSKLLDRDWETKIVRYIRNLVQRWV